MELPWQAIKEWIPDDDSGLNWFNQGNKSTGVDHLRISVALGSRLRLLSKVCSMSEFFF